MSNLTLKGLFLMLLCSGIFPKDSLSQDSIVNRNECDTTVFCSYNDDNVIYLAYKEFTFLLRTTVDSKDFRYYEDLYPVDMFQGPIILKLKILPGCFHDQTMVKYEYQTSDSVFSTETTGLIEDNKKIWIHPPRDLIDEITFSPFFEYRYGRNKWKNGFLIANNNPKISGKKMIWATNKYSKVSDTLVRFKDEVVKCKEIKIKTKHRGKIFYSTMLFNERLGFIWIDIQFINGKHYSLELIGVEPNYCKSKVTEQD